jgi:hypothetical protein
MCSMHSGLSLNPGVTRNDDRDRRDYRRDYRRDDRRDDYHHNDHYLPYLPTTLPYMFGTLGVNLPHLPHLPHHPNRAHTLCMIFRSLGKQALNDSKGW